MNMLSAGMNWYLIIGLAGVVVVLIVISRMQKNR